MARARAHPCPTVRIESTARREYLGVIVHKDGFRPDPSKIEPILKYPEPKNLYSHGRRAPNSIKKKNRKYEWTEEQQAAFEQVKALLPTVPMLQSPWRYRNRRGPTPRN